MPPHYDVCHSSMKLYVDTIPERRRKEHELGQDGGGPLAVTFLHPHPKQTFGVALEVCGVSGVAPLLRRPARVPGSQQIAPGDQGPRGAPPQERNVVGKTVLQKQAGIGQTIAQLEGLAGDSGAIWPPFLFTLSPTTDERTDGQAAKPEACKGKVLRYLEEAHSHYRSSPPW